MSRLHHECPSQRAVHPYSGDRQNFKESILTHINQNLYPHFNLKNRSEAASQKFNLNLELSSQLLSRNV